MGMIPGINKKAIQNAKVDEKAFAHLEAIILSMTEEERNKPEIIKYSRKKRIAAGCGLQVVDVNRLLKQFDQMQQMIKQMSKGGMFGGMGGGMGGLGGFGRMHGLGKRKRKK